MSDGSSDAARSSCWPLKPLREKPCEECGGVQVVRSGEPCMYNCELGGTDCSAMTNGVMDNPDACKKCGKTVPCPKCMPVANKYYNLWNRDAYWKHRKDIKAEPCEEIAGIARPDLQIGWYAPTIERFCYIGEKRRLPTIKRAYSVPVYAIPDILEKPCPKCKPKADGEFVKILRSKVGVPGCRTSLDDVILRAADRIEQLENNGGGCTLSGPGRGDCLHFVGLPGESIPNQHDGDDDTVDVYGKPNGWCWSCWKSQQIAELQSEIRAIKDFATISFNESLLKFIREFEQSKEAEDAPDPR